MYIHMVLFVVYRVLQNILKYKEKNITLVHNNKLDQKWLGLSLKPAAFGGPKKFVLMTFERQREVFSHEEGTFIAYICFIFLYLYFYAFGFIQ